MASAFDYIIQTTGKQIYLHSIVILFNSLFQLVGIFLNPNSVIQGSPFQFCVFLWESDKHMLYSFYYKHL